MFLYIYLMLIMYIYIFVKWSMVGRWCWWTTMSTFSKFKFLQSHINKSLHQKGVFKLWSDGSLASVQRTLGWWGSVGWVGPKSKPIIRDLGRWCGRDILVRLWYILKNDSFNGNIVTRVDNLSFTRVGNHLYISHVVKWFFFFFKSNS